jgi:hypothetical protein
LGDGLHAGADGHRAVWQVNGASFVVLWIACVAATWAAIGTLVWLAVDELAAL